MRYANILRERDDRTGCPGGLYAKVTGHSQCHDPRQQTLANSGLISILTIQSANSTDS